MLLLPYPVICACTACFFSKSWATLLFQGKRTQGSVSLREGSVFPHWGHPPFFSVLQLVYMGIFCCYFNLPSPSFPISPSVMCLYPGLLMKFRIAIPFMGPFWGKNLDVVTLPCKLPCVSKWNHLRCLTSSVRCMVTKESALSSVCCPQWGRTNVLVLS